MYLFQSKTKERLLKNGKTILRALNYVQTINKICVLTWNIEAIIVQKSTCMSDIYFLLKK